MTKTTTATDTATYIRNAAIRLRKAGVEASVVSDALEVPERTIAAWMAHETMGTYK